MTLVGPEMWEARSPKWPSQAVDFPLLFLSFRNGAGTPYRPAHFLARKADCRQPPLQKRIRRLPRFGSSRLPQLAQLILFPARPCVPPGHAILLTACTNSFGHGCAWRRAVALHFSINGRRLIAAPAD
jgi:hypothetical protein